MATSFFAPAIARSREAVITRSTQAVLQLVPELKKEEGEEIQTRAFLFILSGVFGEMHTHTLLPVSSEKIGRIVLAMCLQLKCC